MTDNKRTCGDCAWWKKLDVSSDIMCTCPTPIDSMILGSEATSDATWCSHWRSHADQALIDECHRLRSLGAAVEWSKIDRLVEIAAGRELERGKRCEVCEGHGDYGVYVDLHGDRVECEECHGTGYKKGGER